MQTRVASLVLSGLTSFALVWGAGSTAQAATLPDRSAAFDTVEMEGGPWLDSLLQLAMEDAQPADTALSTDPTRAGVPSDAEEGDEASADSEEADSPEAEGSDAAEEPESAETAQLKGGSAEDCPPPSDGDHGHKPPKHEPPKHEPPKHEPPKHEPPKHEPPKHEPPSHGDHGQKPPHGEHGDHGQKPPEHGDHGDHGHKPGPGQGQGQNQGQNQGQGQAQGQAQGQDQDQAQGQAQGQFQNVVVTVVQENKQENKQDLQNVNHVHSSSVAKASSNQHQQGKGSKPPQHGGGKGGHGTNQSAPHAHKGELAHTGADELALILGAAALVGTGGALVRLRRGRQS